MTLPYTLLLVADRTHGTLPPAVVDVARNMVKGAKPVVLSEGEAIDIPCPAPGPGAPTAATLRATFARHHVDALFLRSRGRRKALLVADMDSTIVRNETLDDLADILGCGEEVTRITEATMNGDLDFAASLRARVALLAGKPAALLEQVWEDVKLNEGAATLVRTMKAHNARTALVSGGFTFFTQRVAETCGFDENYGNEPEIRDGLFTGDLAAPVLGPDSKHAHLLRLAEERGVKLSAALTTGDGANDLQILEAAGLGLAFHAKPRVRAAIETQVNYTSLRTHLFAQGYPASVFVS